MGGEDKNEDREEEGGGKNKAQGYMLRENG